MEFNKSYKFEIDKRTASTLNDDTTLVQVPLTQNDLLTLTGLYLQDEKGNILYNNKMQRYFDMRGDDFKLTLSGDAHDTVTFTCKEDGYQFFAYALEGAEVCRGIEPLDNDIFYITLILGVRLW